MTGDEQGVEMHEKETSLKRSVAGPILLAVRKFEAKKLSKMKSSDTHGNSNLRGRALQTANQMHPTRKLLAGLPCDEKLRDIVVVTS